MIFSTMFWPLALACAAISACLTLFLCSAPADAANENPRRLRPAPAIATFLIVLLSVRICMYYGQPAFIGALYGYWWLVMLTALPACIVSLLVRSSDGSGNRPFHSDHMLNRKRPIKALIFSGVLLVVVPAAQYVGGAWGPYNQQKFANLPKIEVMTETAKIPPTDPDHLVLVTKENAIFKGQSILNKLGTKYKIDTNLYTLQGVNGHRYWLAPLTLINWGDTLNISNATSPGYVVVDAENQETEAQSKLGYQMKLFDDQIWSLYVERFVYQSGWQHGVLGVAKFEVDNQWNPYYVYGYFKKPFAGGQAGQILDKVIVVSVGKGQPSIESYDPNDATARAEFSWVDRAMSKEVVTEYARDWGYYGSQFAKDNRMAIWTGYDKTDANKPSDCEMAYTIGDECVWVIPMTSLREDNHSVSGVLVYETNRNEGKYYPGLQGFNTPESVQGTMKSVQANVNHYEPEQIQLASIFGELTWVAIYDSPQTIGKSFGGIGLLHANAQNSADVVYATDKATALSLYRAQLAQRQGAKSGHISQTSNNSKKITGVVTRKAELPSSTVGAKLMFALKLEGDEHTFLITRDVYADCMLLEKGDEVTLQFADTKDHEVAVVSLTCPNLDNRK